MTTFAQPAGVVSGQYGAAWTFGNGDLGFSNNVTGDIFQISVANPASPTFAVVAHYGGPESSDNGGSACVLPSNVDLWIENSRPAEVARGGTVTWTLTVTNDGPGNSSGFVVDDDVPSGFTDVVSDTEGCAVTGNSVRC